MAIWLKLDTGILSDEKIELIRTLPEGDSLFVLWVGLLCMAMKKETDCLYITQGIPYQADSLSKVLKLKVDTVKLGLEVLERFGMVQITDDGGIVIPKLSTHQSLDKLTHTRELTAARVRKLRENKKSVTRYGVTCNATEETREEKKKSKSVRQEPHGTNGNKVFDATKNVIDLLNEKAGTAFRYGAGTQDKVRKLLKKGYTVQDMRQVVAVKCLKWGSDEKMREYLRPTTLFGPEKFDDYLGEYGKEMLDVD